MTQGRRFENGPEPTAEFLNLITALSEEERDIRDIQVGETYRALGMTPRRQAIVDYFMNKLYPHKIESSILNPQKNKAVRWQNAFIFQEGKMGDNPPGRALIILPINVSEDIHAQEHIVVEIGRPIYVDEKSGLTLSGSGKLQTINLGFQKSG
ncbi:MAG: hypothetical protein M1816_003114 [Peltula sp. TS41687]|nr:MAG: hypothetical protein M1816_003114 [Peltula sp. TS41687]